MEITFKRACEDDAAEIIKARDLSFYGDFVRFGECPGYRIAPEAMKQIIREEILYIITDGAKVIGDISLKKKEDGFYWIHCLEVIPQYQNKGIGKTALEYAEHTHTDAKKFGLDTPVQNTRNCIFYENAGYVMKEENAYSDILTLRIYEKTVGSIDAG